MARDANNVPRPNPPAAREGEPPRRRRPSGRRRTGSLRAAPNQNAVGGNSLSQSMPPYVPTGQSGQPLPDVVGGNFLSRSMPPRMPGQRSSGKNDSMAEWLAEQQRIISEEESASRRAPVGSRKCPHMLQQPQPAGSRMSVPHLQQQQQLAGPRMSGNHLQQQQQQQPAGPRMSGNHVRQKQLPASSQISVPHVQQQHLPSGLRMSAPHMQQQHPSSALRMSAPHMQQQQQPSAQGLRMSAPHMQQQHPTSKRYHGTRPGMATPMENKNIEGLHSPNNLTQQMSNMNIINGGRRLSTSVAQNPSWFNETPKQHNSDQLSNRRTTHGKVSPNDNTRVIPRRITEAEEEDDDCRTMLTKDQALRPSSIRKARTMFAPAGNATIIYTDVQGSTSLWETCPSDMKNAQDIHDAIMRQCYTNHKGYEITTEGDAFNLAFQRPIDALAFALEAQSKLYKANWPKGILAHPDGKDEPIRMQRGFRVRFGMHHGPTSSRVHQATGRTVYSGEAVKIAKLMEGMCHGGQILATVQTWEAARGDSAAGRRRLGNPQVLDCGEHFLYETKANSTNGSGATTTTRYSRRVIQLVPGELAFDYFKARGSDEIASSDGRSTTVTHKAKSSSSVRGRLFPPVLTKRQLTTSFLNAPHSNGQVTICFVHVVGLPREDYDDRARSLSVLSDRVRQHLLKVDPPGYECGTDKEGARWTLAFDRATNAVRFGMRLLQNTAPGPGATALGIGIAAGPFAAMGPDGRTGRAEYFGLAVDAAAAAASDAGAGRLRVGVPLGMGVHGAPASPPDFGSSVRVSPEGIRKVRGTANTDVAIFDCRMKGSAEMPHRR